MSNYRKLSESYPCYRTIESFTNTPCVTTPSNQNNQNNQNNHTYLINQKPILFHWPTENSNNTSNFKCACNEKYKNC